MFIASLPAEGHQGLLPSHTVPTGQPSPHRPLSPGSENCSLPNLFRFKGSRGSPVTCPECGTARVVSLCAALTLVNCLFTKLLKLPNFVSS